MWHLLKRATWYLSGLTLCPFILLACSNTTLKSELEAKPKIHVIKIAKFKFEPKILNIEPGDYVRWENRDIVPHQIAEVTLKTWQSKNLLPNDFFILQIKSPADYICRLHPTMQAKLVLKLKR